MKTIIMVITAFLLFCPMAIEATWSHEVLRIQNFPTGWEVFVKFERDPGGDKKYCTFVFKEYEDIASQGPTRLALKKARLELSYSDLNRFDIGEDSKEILITLIKQIRNNPDITIEQVKTLYDQYYPDALWKADQFFNRARKWIAEQYMKAYYMEQMEKTVKEMYEKEGVPIEEEEVEEVN